MQNQPATSVSKESNSGGSQAQALHASNAEKVKEGEKETAKNPYKDKFFVYPVGEEEHLVRFDAIRRLVRTHATAWCAEICFWIGEKECCMRARDHKARYYLVLNDYYEWLLQHACIHPK
jgi:hypothetical protein